MPTIYHLGGYEADAPAQNKAQEWDDATRVYTSWDEAGSQIEQRAYTTDESAAADFRQQIVTDDANRTTLQTKAQNALAANANYLAISTPTSAQAIAQVAVLTRENTAIIRLLLGLLDSTAGT